MTETEWFASTDPVRMLKGLHISNRKLRLFACGVCRLCWHLLTDPRSRWAVRVAERLADGPVPSEEVAMSRRRAILPSQLTVPPHPSYWWTASVLAGATLDDPLPPLGPLLEGLGREIVSGAPLLRCIAGNPWRPARWTSEKVDSFEGYVVEAWTEDAVRYRTPTVVALATAAYAERLHGGWLDPARLGILADALEEAGCPDGDLLRHLRGQEPCRSCKGTGMIKANAEGEMIPWGCGQCNDGRVAERGTGWTTLSVPHARGCWPLDLVLGKD
jgi:hypothetical protein